MNPVSLNSIFSPCPTTFEQFFADQTSRTLGYIPLIGSVIGVSRLVFSSYQYAQGAPGSTKDRFFEEIVRGTIEALSLGPIILIYDLFFGKIGGVETTSIQSFRRIHSTVFSDHVDQLTRFYSSKTPSAEQLSQYQSYLSSGTHSMNGQPIFREADFYTRHGLMHASFVALFVPVFISLYRNAGHSEAASLNQEDILALQVVAFLHDYGRVSEGMDLVTDHERLERIGEVAAYRYLREAMGFSEDRARRFSHFISTKDAPLAGKSLLEQVLQNCDCLAVLRADDWQFDKSYLDLEKWIHAQIPVGPNQDRALEELNSVIDAAKRMLVAMGDSPYSMPCQSHAERGQLIQGRFSLESKRNFEKSLECYELELRELRRHPVLWTHFSSNV